MSHPATENLSPELAARLRQALTAGADELFQVLLDPAPAVLRAALKNRALNEEHLLALLKRRDLPEDLLKAIQQLETVGSSHRLQLALATNPGTPSTLVLALLPHLFLFELLNICLLSGPGPDQKLAAERAILQRLPTVELGSKLTLARRGTPAIISELLKEGDARIIEACLDSPQMREVALLQFLSGPRATAETISLIARHPRWKQRPNLRLALLKHHKTPAVWFTLLLPQLPLPDLQSLRLTRRLTVTQRELVEEEVKRRGLRRSPPR